MTGGGNTAGRGWSTASVRTRNPAGALSPPGMYQVALALVRLPPGSAGISVADLVEVAGSIDYVGRSLLDMERWGLVQMHPGTTHPVWLASPTPLLRELLDAADNVVNGRPVAAGLVAEACVLLRQAAAAEPGLAPNDSPLPRLEAVERWLRSWSEPVVDGGDDVFAATLATLDESQESLRSRMIAHPAAPAGLGSARALITEARAILISRQSHPTPSVIGAGLARCLTTKPGSVVPRSREEGEWARERILVLLLVAAHGDTGIVPQEAARELLHRRGVESPTPAEVTDCVNGVIGPHVEAITLLGLAETTGEHQGHTLTVPREVRDLVVPVQDQLISGAWGDVLRALTGELGCVVAFALSDQGSDDLEELADRSGLTKRQVYDVIKRLAVRGLLLGSGSDLERVALAPGMATDAVRFLARLASACAEVTVARGAIRSPHAVFDALAEPATHHLLAHVIDRRAGGGWVTTTTAARSLGLRAGTISLGLRRLEQCHLVHGVGVRLNPFHQWVPAPGVDAVVDGLRRARQIGEQRAWAPLRWALASVTERGAEAGTEAPRLGALAIPPGLFATDQLSVAALGRLLTGLGLPASVVAGDLGWTVTEVEALTGGGGRSDLDGTSLAALLQLAILVRVAMPLRWIRLALGWSQQEVGERAGLSIAEVAACEDLLAAVARALAAGSELAPPPRFGAALDLWRFYDRTLRGTGPDFDFVRRAFGAGSRELASLTPFSEAAIFEFSQSDSGYASAQRFRQAVPIYAWAALAQLLGRDEGQVATLLTLVDRFDRNPVTDVWEGALVLGAGLELSSFPDAVARGVVPLTASARLLQTATPRLRAWITDFLECLEASSESMARSIGIGPEVLRAIASGSDARFRPLGLLLMGLDARAQERLGDRFVTDMAQLDNRWEDVCVELGADPAHVGRALQGVIDLGAPLTIRLLDEVVTRAAARLGQVPALRGWLGPPWDTLTARTGHNRSVVLRWSAWRRGQPKHWTVTDVCELWSELRIAAWEWLPPLLELADAYGHSPDGLDSVDESTPIVERVAQLTEALFDAARIFLVEHEERLARAGLTVAAVEELAGVPRGTMAALRERILPGAPRDVSKVHELIAEAAILVRAERRLQSLPSLSGGVFAEVRERSGVSRTEVLTATVLDVSDHTLRDWEEGRLALINARTTASLWDGLDSVMTSRWQELHGVLLTAGVPPAVLGERAQVGLAQIGESGEWPPDLTITERAALIDAAWSLSQETTARLVVGLSISPRAMSRLFRVTIDQGTRLLARERLPPAVPAAILDGFARTAADPALPPIVNEEDVLVPSTDQLLLWHRDLEVPVTAALAGVAAQGDTGSTLTLYELAEEVALLAQEAQARMAVSLRIRNLLSISAYVADGGGARRSKGRVEAYEAGTGRPTIDRVARIWAVYRGRALALSDTVLDWCDAFGIAVPGNFLGTEPVVEAVAGLVQACAVAAAAFVAGAARSARAEFRDPTELEELRQGLAAVARGESPAGGLLTKAAALRRSMGGPGPGAPRLPFSDGGPPQGTQLN